MRIWKRWRITDLRIRWNDKLFERTGRNIGEWMYPCRNRFWKNPSGIIWVETRNIMFVLSVHPSHPHSCPWNDLVSEMSLNATTQSRPLTIPFNLPNVMNLFKDFKSPTQQSGTCREGRQVWDFAGLTIAIPQVWSNLSFGLIHIHRDIEADFDQNKWRIVTNNHILWGSGAILLTFIRIWHNRGWASLSHSKVHSVSGTGKRGYQFVCFCDTTLNMFRN